MVAYDADVAVVGVGSIGSMALWRIISRGLSVVGFERFGIGHDRSGAGGETRLFRTNTLGDERYVTLSRAALPIWRELEALSGSSLLNLCGELVIGPKVAPGMKNVLSNASKFELRHRRLDRDEMQDRYPQHCLRSDDIGVLDIDAGFIRSQMSVIAAAQVARSLGAQIEEYATIHRVTDDGSGVVVDTGHDEYRFRSVVLAAGPWVAGLIKPLGFEVTVRRPIQAWFAVDSGADFEPERCPAFIRTGSSPYYGFPSTDGFSIKLGLSGADNKVVSDPDSLDRSVSVDEIRRFREIASGFLCGIHEEPIRLGAYMDAYATDGYPLIGPLPGSPNIVTLGAFSGIGFKFAPIFGDIGADFAMDRQTSPDFRFMSVDRIHQSMRS